MKLSHFVLLCREWRGGTQLHYKCWKAFTIIFYLEIAKITLFHHCAVHMKCLNLPDLLQTHAEMKEIEHLALFAPSRVHICMINDCSPQHFTLAHFTDGLADKKLCPSAVCSGGKKWDLWPLGCLTVVFQNGTLPYFGSRYSAQLWPIGQHWGKFYGAVCLTLAQNFHWRIIWRGIGLWAH